MVEFQLPMVPPLSPLSLNWLLVAVTSPSLLPVRKPTVELTTMGGSIVIG